MIAALAWMIALDTTRRRCGRKSLAPHGRRQTHLSVLIFLRRSCGGRCSSSRSRSSRSRGLGRRCCRGRCCSNCADVVGGAFLDVPGLGDADEFLVGRVLGAGGVGGIGARLHEGGLGGADKLAGCGIAVASHAVSGASHNGRRLRGRRDNLRSGRRSFGWSRCWRRGCSRSCSFRHNRCRSGCRSLGGSSSHQTGNQASGNKDTFHGWFSRVNDRYRHWVFVTQHVGANGIPHHNVSTARRSVSRNLAEHFPQFVVERHHFAALRPRE